jgi:hypothetical protein
MTEPTPRPVVQGFTVKWDPLQGEWLATSRSGNYRVRGRTQSELTGHRWALYAQALAQFRSAIAELYPLRPR